MEKKRNENKKKNVHTVGKLKYNELQAKSFEIHMLINRHTQTAEPTMN